MEGEDQVDGWAWRRGKFLFFGRSILAFIADQYDHRLAIIVFVFNIFQ
jgi:hypothetical protein